VAAAGIPSRLTSIVIPLYNAERSIKDAIDSALEQGAEGDRLIVVDDGSTDGSAKIVKAFGARVRLISTPNGGASRARNTGLSYVTTRYVVFLDADDVYEGPIIASLEAVAEERDAEIAFGTLQNVEPDGTWAERELPPDPSEPDAFLIAWLGGQTVGTNSQLWRTDFLRAIGGWDERMKTREEIEHVARGILKGARLAASHVGTSLYRHTENPNRVGYGSSEAVVRSAVDGWERLAMLAGDQPEVHRVLGRRIYDQARAAFRLGYKGLGRQALVRSRALGFHGDLGSPMHRRLVKLLGLERKEAISRLVNAIAPQRNDRASRRARRQKWSDRTS
jgi:glycosyltransferase involved in cell wall biosynthesis